MNQYPNVIELLRCRERGRISINRSLSNIYSQTIGSNSITFSRQFLEYSSIVSRLAHFRTLPVHNGCVNTLSWSDDGRLLLSGGDDRQLIISDPFDPVTDSVRYRIPTGHGANIFSACFLPCTDSSQIISCAADGTVILTDLHRPESAFDQIYHCQHTAALQLATIDRNPHTFLCCSDDCRVRWYDRRVKTSCTTCVDDVIIECQCSTTSIAVDPTRPYSLAVGCSDGLVRIYDMRMLNKPTSDTIGVVGLVSLCCAPNIVEQPQTSRRITWLGFSADGHDLMVSFAPNHICTYRTRDYVDEKQDITMMNTIGDRKPKKIRLLGDWSDTGPSFMPNSSGGDDDNADATGSDFVRRVRSFLTSWIDRAEEAVNSANTAGRRSVPTEEETTSVMTDGQNTTTSELSSVADESGASASTSTDERRRRLGERIKILNENRRRFLYRLLQRFPQHKCTAVLNGHRNVRTMLKQAAYWGRGHVMSGSDCGHLFVWRRCDRRLLLTVPADRHVINCVQPHPFLPILATSGIDYDIKCWMPSTVSSCEYDQRYIDTVVERNQQFLAESQDTVTVPASFFLRLASRLGRRRRNEDNTNDDENSNQNDDDDDDDDMGSSSS